MKISNLKEALDIFAKYTDKDYLDLAAEHDIIYFPFVNESMTREDVNKLVEFGFFTDEDSDCWCHHV